MMVLLSKGAGANGADEIFTAYPKNVNVIDPTKSSVAAETVNGFKSTVGNIKNDIIPSVDQLVNHNITRALDLTQGDLKNISASTGQEVGKFVAEKNLIGRNKAETVTKIDSFYKQNYKRGSS
jgi:hypothetical protein